MIQIILCRQRNNFFIYDFEYLYLEQADEKSSACTDCRKTVFLESRETRFFSILVSKFKNIDKIE